MHHRIIESAHAFKNIVEKVDTEIRAVSVSVCCVSMIFLNESISWCVQNLCHFYSRDTTEIQLRGVFAHLQQNINRIERQPANHNKKMQSKVPPRVIVRPHGIHDHFFVSLFRVYLRLCEFRFSRLLIYRYAKLCPFNRPAYLRIQLKSDCVRKKQATTGNGE